MRSLASKLKWLLPVKDKSKPIEERLFQTTLTLTILTLLLWALIGLLSGYTLLVEGLYVFALLFYSVLYIAFKQGKSFRKLSLIYYLTALALIAVGWLPSGGIQGAIMHMCVLVYLSGLLVLPLKVYRLFMAAALFIVAAFVVLEYFYPHLAVTYTERITAWRDLSIAGVLMLTLMGVALFIFKKEQLEDKNNLKRINEELEKEKEKVEMADKAKSQFLATISHEMRTPLNGVVGITELLAKTHLDAEQRELTDKLAISSNMLHALISDVLDLSMIENGKIELNESGFRLKESMQEVIGIFETRLKNENKPVRINYQHDAHIPDVLIGDWLRIRQILVNLINNAAKFTDEGTITVSAGLSWKSENTVSVRFGVEDTGPGIPGELQEELFKRFFKADKNRKLEGTGLGLSISKSLVEMMGGKIWFTSVLHVGSSFFVEIPLKAGRPVSRLHQPEPEMTVPLTDLKILVAEDVEINRMVMIKVLRNLGVSQIEVAENGKEAVEKAAAVNFDFILMDVQMPVMDGIEASLAIQEQATKNGLQPPVIIAVTANTMKEDAEACRAAGMTDFVTKPFKSATLSGIFQRHLEARLKAT